MSGSLMRNTRAAGQHGSPVENQPREEGSGEDEDVGLHRSSTASSTGHRICPPRAPLLLPTTGSNGGSAPPELPGHPINATAALGESIL